MMWRSKKTQPARSWTAADICTNCVCTNVSTQSLPDSVLFWTSRPLLSAAWLALLLTKAGYFELNPGPTTHTNKYTPHWVHLKCKQIKQRQYKPDWRCTIHRATQNVTTTPSTANTTPHHKETTTHQLTNNNQPKDKNIVILQININGIRNKI